jgi:ABC-type multidrug transport system ATPase subunit
MSDRTVGSPAIRIEELTIRLPDGRCLLERASLVIPSGELVVLSGPSGSGKSTLLHLISGLGEDRIRAVEAHGRITVMGLSPPSRARSSIGVVFQELALFDELTAEQNVRFAIDHRDRADRPARSSVGAGAVPGAVAIPREEALALLHRLGVPAHRRPAHLSGGERQRVALARTLAMHPSLLLFDEPTTGLDPRRAREVVDLITATHREPGRTVIVVTHDFEPFLPRGPRLVLLDPDRRTLRDVDASELHAFFASPTEERPSVAQQAPEDSPPPRRPIREHRTTWRDMLAAPGEALLILLGAMPAVTGGWRHAWWKLRYLWHYARMSAVGTSVPYVAIAGLMLGFVTVFFGFRQLPYRQVMLPLLTEEFLSATGYSTYRVLVPLLTCLLLAGKGGAAVAADVGARRLTHQDKAMRSLGASPRSYLYGGATSALVMAAPVLTLLAFVFCTAAALVAFLLVAPDATPTLFRRHYMATVWPSGFDIPEGTWWVIGKCMACGLLTAALAWHIGGREKNSAADVSRDVGRTIFWSSLAVLALHAVVAFWEY